MLTPYARRLIDEYDRRRKEAARFGEEIARLAKAEFAGKTEVQKKEDEGLQKNLPDTTEQDKQTVAEQIPEDEVENFSNCTIRAGDVK